MDDLGRHQRTCPFMLLAERRDILVCSSHKDRQVGISGERLRYAFEDDFRPLV